MNDVQKYQSIAQKEKGEYKKAMDAYMKTPEYKMFVGECWGRKWKKQMNWLSAQRDKILKQEGKKPKRSGKGAAATVLSGGSQTNKWKRVRGETRRGILQLTTNAINSEDSRDRPRRALLLSSCYGARQCPHLLTGVPGFQPRSVYSLEWMSGEQGCTKFFDLKIFQVEVSVKKKKKIRNCNCWKLFKVEVEIRTSLAWRVNCRARSHSTKCAKVDWRCRERATGGQEDHRQNPLQHRCYQRANSTRYVFFFSSFFWRICKKTITTAVDAVVVAVKKIKKSCKSVGCELSSILDSKAIEDCETHLTQWMTAVLKSFEKCNASALSSLPCELYSIPTHSPLPHFSGHVSRVDRRFSDRPLVRSPLSSSGGSQASGQQPQIACQNRLQASFPTARYAERGADNQTI